MDADSSKTSADVPAPSNPPRTPLPTLLSRELQGMLKQTLATPQQDGNQNPLAESPTDLTLSGPAQNELVGASPPRKKVKTLSSGSWTRRGSTGATLSSLMADPTATAEELQARMAESAALDRLKALRAASRSLETEELTKTTTKDRRVSELGRTTKDVIETANGGTDMQVAMLPERQAQINKDSRHQSAPAADQTQSNTPVISPIIQRFSSLTELRKRASRPADSAAPAPHNTMSDTTSAPLLTKTTPPRKRKSSRLATSTPPADSTTIFDASPVLLSAETEEATPLDRRGPDVPDVSTSPSASNEVSIASVNNVLYNLQIESAELLAQKARTVAHVQALNLQLAQAQAQVGNLKMQKQVARESMTAILKDLKLYEELEKELLQEKVRIKPQFREAFEYLGGNQ